MRGIIRSNNHFRQELIKDNAMHISRLLHKFFLSTSKKIDRRIHKTLLSAALTLSDSKELSIAALGRHLESSAKTKHNIKRIDRLFGNKNLHERVEIYYQQMTRTLLEGNLNPVILIDWSGLTTCRKFHFLRASVPVGGRSLTLLDMTFPESESGSRQAHWLFLKQLKHILPSGSYPTLVTDAGFRGTWFKMVKQMNWEFVGRVRNRTGFQPAGLEHWLPVKSLYAKARNKARFICSALLAKRNPIACHLYLVKEARKQRIKKNLKGERYRSAYNKQHEKREREPLLIASSLNPETHTPYEIINIYKKRMQIEEAFRDLKNTKNGFSLRHCKSLEPNRLNVALLIANITALLLWLVGLSVKRVKAHFSFQASSIRTRNVLSTFTIGWQYLKKKKNIPLSDFQQAIQELQYHALN